MQKIINVKLKNVLGRKEFEFQNTLSTLWFDPELEFDSKYAHIVGNTIKILNEMQYTFNSTYPYEHSMTEKSEIEKHINNMLTKTVSKYPNFIISEVEEINIAVREIFKRIMKQKRLEHFMKTAILIAIIKDMPKYKTQRVFDLLHTK